MTTTNDRDFVKKFQQSEIATSAYEAAGRAFTDGIIGNLWNIFYCLIIGPNT
jgi:hypothetical protein